MNATAVVLASGSGERFGTPLAPKHLTRILEVPVLVWTLSAVVRSGLFSAISVVVREMDIPETETEIKDYFADDTHYLRLTQGSQKRIQSFFRGLDDLVKARALAGDTIVALIDANRPLVPISQLQDLHSAALKFGCSCLGRPVVNGIAQTSAGHIEEVPNKSSFVEFLTPEFMKFSALQLALKRHPEDLPCLVEYALVVGIKPVVLDASPLNAKLTYAEDVTHLEGLARKNSVVAPSKLGVDALNYRLKLSQ